ncbi:MAG TPA: DNA-3-methyladenine glycosylase [Candidatus Baltobacteraceae bacterium]|nr:DNA-3-methyladenine glycosylase [Candidatus Baltobacteraceae bacterium]
MPRYRRLAADELPPATIDLAKALIGCVLVRDCPDGRSAGRIVETEAYVRDDPASHAYRGETRRNASMFLEPFRAYVYKIYGTSFCVNVTSETPGEGAAVLVRALEPLEGLGLMERRRGTTRVRDLARGPGRLCQALDVDLALDGIDLLRDERLWLAAPHGAAAGRLAVGKSRRIGVTKAAERLLRFYERANPFVSGPKALSP